MPTNRVILGALFSVLFSLALACEDTGNDFGEGAGGAGVVGQDGGHGLKGTYFDNMDFTDQVLDRVDAVVDFEWGHGSPDSKVGSDSFSVRWTGFVEPEYSQTYTFYTVGDDGIRLYVNGELVVNDWSNHGARERSGTIALKAGQLYSIKLEYYEDGGGAVAKLLWSSSSQAKQVIPQERLYTEVPSDGPIITASGENSKYGEVKENAFDGDTKTKWLTFADSAWIQYDFAGDASKVITQYSITSANDAQERDPKDWTLLGSNDGSRFTTVDERSGERFSSRFQTRTFAVQSPGAFKMYRLNVSSNFDPPSAHSTQLAEIELKEGGVVDNCPDDPNKTEPGECGCGIPEGSCSGEVSNVALGKPTAQSTTAYSGESSRAVDGNTSGNWSDGSITHTSFEIAPWWEVDLGAAYRVERVVLFNRTNCCSDRLSNFHVDYLDEQGNVIATKAHAGQVGSDVQIALAASGVYGVRVQLNGTNFLSLAEVQVLGSLDAGGAQLCAQVNEGRTAALSCQNGEKITRIDFASYGLPEGSCDGGFAAGSCHAFTSQAKVEEACLNQSACTVPASNGVFGDPCSGKAKSLSVVYTCGAGSAVEDLCPGDPNKTAPGVCGCGTPDIDSDNNGVFDCNEIDCSDTLAPDEMLEQDEFLCSPSGRYEFGLTDAGRLVFLDNGSTIWDAGFSGATFLAMQGGDGHLVAYRAVGDPLWGSGTASSANKDAVSLVAQDSGRAALLKDGSTLLWWVDKDGEHDTSDIPVDLCPYDSSKVTPGVCGCNVPEYACDGVTVDRVRGSDLRIGVYNVLRSSIFPEDDGDPDGHAARIAGFKRVAAAVNADIWAMQEVMYDGNDQPGRTPNGLKRYMEKITGRTLYMAHHDKYQEFIFSRYPIDASGSPGHRMVWALIDVGNDNNRDNDLLLLSVHFVTDGQGSSTADFVLDVKAGKKANIPKDITIVVAGDFNNQPEGSRYKDVRSAFGQPDLRPIWLGTPNTRFTHGGLTYSNGAFRVPQNGNPIDYIFARTSSYYEIAKNFVLSTLVLDQSVLDAHGLERMDVAVDPGQNVSNGTNVNCDHFPLFVDLKSTR